MDLDYAHSPLLGDQLHGYYRLGIVRANYPNSNITVKINRILTNFYFEEADQTIYDFKGYNFRNNIIFKINKFLSKCDLINSNISQKISIRLSNLYNRKEDHCLHDYNSLTYSDFDIIIRHTYNVGAKRSFYSSFDSGLDFPLLSDPNDRDFTKAFQIHPEVFRFLPKLRLKKSKIIEQKVNNLLLSKYNYQDIVYLAFREGLRAAEHRNFKDNILEKVILKLSESFPKTLFIMHTYLQKWAHIFNINKIRNVLAFSQLTNDEINNLNIHEKSFKTVECSANLNLEIIYYLINKSNLFITGGNTGLGCFAQYIQPNMLCYVALNEINWITKHDRYYSCIRKDRYSDFSVNDIYDSCVKSINETLRK